jgi:hypothetical protein
VHSPTLAQHLLDVEEVLEIFLRQQLYMIHFFFASKFALFATVFHFFANPPLCFHHTPLFFRH